VQDSKVALMSQASFGLTRPAKILIRNHLQHKINYPKKPKFTPYTPKGMPEYLENFDLVQTKGGWPFTGKKESHLHRLMRFKKQLSDFSDAHLLALFVIWPPTSLQILRKPAMASTISWNLAFIHPHQKSSGSD
jgi:hypothetical protein